MLFPSFGAMRGLCGIAMEVTNGRFLDHRFYMELEPRTRLFKVQGMGHGRLKPERRSSRFEIGSAHQIQFSKNWHMRARSRSSRRRSGVHGFPSFSGGGRNFFTSPQNGSVMACLHSARLMVKNPMMGSASWTRVLSCAVSPRFSLVFENYV